MSTNSDWLNQFIGHLQSINQEANASVLSGVPDFRNIGNGNPGPISAFSYNPVPLQDVSGGPNWFQRITDVALRPLYTVSDALTASVNDIKGAIFGENGSEENPLAAAWEGASGQNKGTFIDTAKALGLPNQLANVAGTAANLYGDPANAVAGALKLGLTKGVSAATGGKALIKAGRAAQAAQAFKDAAEKARQQAQQQAAAQHIANQNAAFNQQIGMTTAANKNVAPPFSTVPPRVPGSPGVTPGVAPGTVPGMTPGPATPLQQVINSIGSNKAGSGKFGGPKTGVPFVSSPNVTPTWAPGLSIKNLVDELGNAGQVSDIKALPPGTGTEPVTPRFTAGQTSAVNNIEDRFATPETKAAYKGVIDDALNSVGTRTTAMGNVSSPYTDMVNDLGNAVKDPTAQAAFVARYKDILHPTDFAALQRVRSPEAFSEVAQNILNRTKPQEYQSLNEFVQAAYHNEIPPEEVQKVLDAAGVSSLSELTKAYKRAGGSPTSKLKPHIPDPNEEPQVTIHPPTEQPAAPVADQVANDLQAAAAKGSDQINEINDVANSDQTLGDAVHVEQIKANRGTPMDDKAQGIRANGILKEEINKIKNISYSPAEATKAIGSRTYERLATLENEERLAGTPHTFTAGTEPRYIGLSDVLHLLGPMGTSKFFANFRTKLTGETLGKMGAAAVDGHKLGLQGDELIQHIIDVGTKADQAAPLVGKGRNLGNTLTSITQVAQRLGKYADILVDKEAANSAIFSDVFNKAAGSVVRDSMTQLTHDLGDTGITANAVDDVANLPGMVSKNAGNHEGVKNAAGVVFAEHAAKMVDPSDILASKVRKKNAATHNSTAGKPYSPKATNAYRATSTGVPGTPTTPTTSAPGTPPVTNPVGPATAPVPGPTVVNGNKVANNLNATARNQAQQMNHIANQNMIGHYPQGMTPLDQIDIDFANQQNLLAAKNANPIWALLGSWAGKGYQIADEAVRGRVTGTTTIIAFDKVITDEFKNIPVDMQNEAFAAIQGGYWPTDPTVLQVTQRMRYYMDRAGFDTSHMPGTPTTTQPLVGSVWGGPYQDADILKAMAAAKIHPSTFTPTPAQAALMQGMSPRQMMSATYRYATIEKPLEFIQKHNGVQVNLGYQSAIGAHFSAQFASPTRLPGYVRIDELKMPKNQQTYFHQYIAKHDMNGQPLYYPKEALQWMTETEKIFNMATSFHGSNSAVARFINNNMDPLIGAWKFLITAARPGFVVKNFIGDVLLSMGAGVHGIKPYSKAFQTLKAGGHFDPLTADKIAQRLGDPSVAAPVGTMRVNVRLKNGQMVTLNDHQVYNLAYQSGVLPSFLLSEGVLEAKALAEGTKGLKKASDKLLSTKYAQGMGWLSEQSSYLPRLAQFIHHLEDSKFSGKFSDIRELRDAAANNVRKYHPDVTGLAPGGQKYMRRIYPFYSWNRLTLPTMVEMALTKPTTITAVPKLLYGINQMLGSDSTDPSQQWPVTRLLPSYIRNTLGEVGGNFTFNAGTPAETLNDFMTKGVRANVLGNLSPFFKIPADLLSGSDIGTGAPIKDKAEYIDQQLPGVQQLSDFTGTDIVGSLQSLVTGQGPYDPLRSVQSGKRSQFNGWAIANFLAGLGIKDVSNTSDWLAIRELNGRN